MKYTLNDKTTLLPLLLYGLQWFVVSIPSILIIGAVTAGVHGLTAAEQLWYMQKVFCITGAAMLVQVLVGHKLPIVIGPASVLLIGIVSSSTAEPSAVYTAILLGGMLIATLAYTGLFTKMQRFFTPRIVIVILAMIAFTLAPTILKLIFEQGGNIIINLCLALGLCVGMFLASFRLKDIWKATVVIAGLIIGTVAYFFIYGAPTVLQPEQNQTLADLFSFRFSIDAGVILSFMCCFVALSVNELGSIQSVGRLVKADSMPQRTKRGVGIIGLFNMVAGAFGVIGPIDYSLSPGVISSTGCGSRYPFIPASIGLILLAFCPWLLTYFGSIPGLIMGVVLLYLMTTQLSASLQLMIQDKAVSTFNHGLIIGFPLMVAILVSFAPREAMAQIPAVIRPIVGNGFVMGIITALLLEHVILRDKKVE